MYAIASNSEGIANRVIGLVSPKKGINPSSDPEISPEVVSWVWILLFFLIMDSKAYTLNLLASVSEE